MVLKTRRWVVAAVATLLLTGTAGVAQAGVPTATASADATPKAAKLAYFVHGYGYDEGVPGGKDCDKTWGDAANYFDSRGWDRANTTGIAYYEGDVNCGARVHPGATLDTSIKDIAAGLAHYIYANNTSKGESIDIVAHSMGGLITRVALLGTAQGWEGFPRDDGNQIVKLKVDNVVTLGTPHQGVIDENAETSDNQQWQQMDKDSNFMNVLHADENQLNQAWASGTDWSFVGSEQDETVSANSAIDLNNPAQHKYIYKTPPPPGVEPNTPPAVTHVTIRTAYADANYHLRWMHASDGEQHDSSNGWAPLETAYNALTRGTDW